MEGTARCHYRLARNNGEPCLLRETYRSEPFYVKSCEAWGAAIACLRTRRTVRDGVLPAAFPPSGGHHERRTRSPRSTGGRGPGYIGLPRRPGTQVISRTEHKDASGHVHAVSQ